MKQININSRIIGDGAAPYIVAELSGNHNGSLERAKAIITEAKKCGADAIKIQTFKPDSITLPSNREEFMITHGLWKGSNLYNLYQETCVPYEWHQELFLHAKETDITLFSTPFSEKDVEFLETLNVCAYKIASNEFTHYPLIKEVLKTNKPIILSTGTATWEEIESTVNFLEKHSCKNYIILYCVSAYPTPVEELNLFTIRELKSRLGCLVGLSDHSMGIIAPVVSVSLGTCFIEKHFTLDRADGGSDSSFSLEPAELKALCETALVAYQSLGEPFFGYKSCEKKSPIFKRHYYSIAGIKEGDILSLDNVAAVRSPTGISSRDFEKVIGQRAANDIPKHEPIQWNDIDDE